MLYYERIDVSEGIDVNKTRKSKDGNTFHYWYFLNKRIKFHANVYNRCHDLLIMNWKVEHYINETSLTIFKAVKKLKITKKVKNYKWKENM